MIIPDQSEASLKNGIWFIYNDSMNTIQVWGSNVNGKEKVFLNNELVSEQRNMKKQSVHKFTDNKGQNYEVNIETVKPANTGLVCSIKRDETLIKSFQTEYIKGKNALGIRMLLIIIASAIFGVIKSFYNLPDLSLIIFIFLMVVIHLTTRNNGELKIKEE